MDLAKRFDGLFANRGFATQALKMADDSRPQLKKPSFPVSEKLLEYLRLYRRERALPVTYDRLNGFEESCPLEDANGEPTLWDSVIYNRLEMGPLHEDLKRVYALLRTAGDTFVLQHVYVDRIDYCGFGNSAPFRIRIVNAFNDNADYFYIKKGDASRIYGLELEHLLSPNRMNYFTCGNSLVEEHVAGIPGNVFIEDWLERKNSYLNPVRVAKELVKFNERCFIRLLGDMRSYNFVMVVTPDFEGAQLRLRAMDFDQQTYEGRLNFYRPQFFPENRSFALYCIKHLRTETAHQYQREEQVAILHRAAITEDKLGHLLEAMAGDEISPMEHRIELREALAEHFKRNAYLQCKTMGELVRENLETIRLNAASSMQGTRPPILE